MDNVKASLRALTGGQSDVENLRNAVNNSNIPEDDKKTAVETAFREDLQAYSVSSLYLKEDGHLIKRVVHALRSTSIRRWSSL